jgi:putative PIN family toxin of toxin-antitoxin system
VRQVVADSNVFVSALVYGGKPLEVLEMGLEREIHLLTSPAILEETLGVLRDKFGYTPQQLEESKLRVEAACYSIVRPSVKLDVVKDDPDDNKVLELAVQMANSVIVSGDKHLLKLGEFQGVKIRRPADFLAESRQR